VTWEKFINETRTDSFKCATFHWNYGTNRNDSDLTREQMQHLADIQRKWAFALPIQYNTGNVTYNIVYIIFTTKTTVPNPC